MNSMKNKRYAIASPTSMGVRITPLDRMAVQNSNQFLSLFALTPGTPIINLLDTLHDEVLEQRKNEEQVFSSTNSVL